MSNAVEVRISAAVGEAQRALADLGKTFQQAGRDMGAGMAPANQAMKEAAESHKGLAGILREHRSEMRAESGIARVLARDFAVLGLDAKGAGGEISHMLGALAMGGTVGIALAGIGFIANQFREVGAAAKEAAERTDKELEKIRTKIEEVKARLAGEDPGRIARERDLRREQGDLERYLETARQLGGANLAMYGTGSRNDPGYNAAEAKVVRLQSRLNALAKQIGETYGGIDKLKESISLRAELVGGEDRLDFKGESEEQDKANETARKAAAKDEAKDRADRLKAAQEAEAQRVANIINAARRRGAAEIETAQATDERLAADQAANDKAEDQRIQVLIAKARREGAIRIEVATEVDRATQDATAQSAQKWMQFSAGASGAVGRAFGDILLRGKNLEEGLGAMFEGIAASFEQMVEDMIAKLVMSGILSFLGSIIGGPVGGYLGAQGAMLIGGKRAEGGSITAGIPYLVGERGPELVIPGASGNVIPNHALGGAGGGTTVVNITAMDSQDVYRALTRNGSGTARALGELARAGRI